MSNIANAFRSNNKAFIVFLTAGDPSIEKSAEFVIDMVGAGADLVEIGIPFSDPIAEGPVIQRANIRALKNGASMEKVFWLIEQTRLKTQVPLVFLTYLNPVFHYGYEAFFKRCKQTGVDGLIIPDMPFEEQGEVKDSASAYGVDVISLVAPTSEERIKEIAAKSTGFIYIVSSMGVTGVRDKIETNIDGIVKAAHSAADTPAAVGFGINTPDQAARIAKSADGVIVGSAIVRIIEEYGKDAGPHLAAYVKQMKSAIAD
ncbi:MAG: tryptophan synthase subunit alpha [Treponema sp.]|jgi:tryptophan synthase alpha chain|nr:tryptophan synthase subunit alpha [Treponema sp.]